MTAQVDDTPAEILFGTKTRGNILRASLALFNDQGYDRVTTASIAKASDVLDGTLWYHFKAKHDIVAAHLDALEQHVAEHFDVPMRLDPAAPLASLETMFARLWQFRYLLRDPVHDILRDHAGAERLQGLYTNLEDKIQTRFREAEVHGILNLERADITSLAQSCLIVGRYWLDYATIRYADTAMTSAQIQQAGMAHILQILRPYITDATFNLYR